MDTKGFGNEFNWFLKDLVSNPIEFWMDSKGCDNEFNWFPKEYYRIWCQIWMILQWILKDVSNEVNLFPTEF